MSSEQNPTKEKIAFFSNRDLTTCLREIRTRTAWCQQPSERDKAEEEHLYKEWHLYRQARTYPRC